MKPAILLIVIQSWALRGVWAGCFPSEQESAAVFQQPQLALGRQVHSSSGAPKQNGTLASSISGIIHVQAGKTRHGAAVQLSSALPTN